MLTVVEKLHTDKVIRGSNGRTDYVRWVRCKCDCGNVIDRRRDSLKKKALCSCGCTKNYEQAKRTKQKVHFDKYIGKTFSRLTVLGPYGYDIGNNGMRYTRLKCRCVCGNTTTVRATYLTRSVKPIRSCGCLSDKVRKREGTLSAKRILDSLAKKC